MSEKVKSVGYAIGSTRGSTVGYTTGTFDDLHLGHIEFLKMCRQRCDMLIVGLVTDELAAKQKRVPTMKYTQRRDILIHFPFVDAVVAHSGDSKFIAWEKVCFNILFIGEEYFDTEEYEPSHDYEVVFIPAGPARAAYNSTRLYQDRAFANITQLTILKDGTAGPVFRQGDFVFKTIRISQLEFSDRVKGANTYQIPFPPPRNLKRKGFEHKYPNLPGINGYREVLVQPFIKSHNWNPTVECKKIFEYEEPTTISVPRGDWSHIRQDKEHARVMYGLFQKYCGPTLDEWITVHQKDTGFIETFKEFIKQVAHICAHDLASQGLIHGDIHPMNICVQEKVGNTVTTEKQKPEFQLFLIDFGWCMHPLFPMCEDERSYYDQCLTEHWDWNHFLNSLEWLYDTREWYPQLGI